MRQRIKHHTIPTRRAALAAIVKLESIRKEPEELLGLLRGAEGANTIRKYLKMSDAATHRLICAFLDYMAAIENWRKVR